MIRVSNSLDPDQARQNVGPDLGTNCLKSWSADDTEAGKELIYKVPCQVCDKIFGMDWSQKQAMN